jgi:glycosyltransferase involved in cell wall biosynthesis
MTRVLWVSAEEPDARLGGGSIRQAYLLEALASRAETHLLLAGKLAGDAPVRQVLAGVTQTARRSRRPSTVDISRRLDHLSWALLERRPRDTQLTAPVQRALRAELERLPPHDVVCVEHHILAPVISRTRHSRWALTMHFVPSEVASHHTRIAPNSWQRWLWRRERSKARRYERWIMSSYDVVFAVSDDDAIALSGGVVVPNGVDTSRFSPTPVPHEPGLVMTGTLGYRPNVDAARWFCAEVLPLIRREVPSASLMLVGRDPAPEVLDLARQPGVRVEADVPSIVPYLEAARVALVPMRVGSGTRIKALEAMAAGRPVVGTTIGLAGLGLEPGRHAMIADDPADLASAAARLLTDDRLARHIAVEARALVEERFGWERVADGFVDELLKCAPAAGTAR